MNNFELAIRSNGLTKTSVAAIASISRPTLDRKIAAPYDFTLNEFFSVWRELDDDGKQLLDSLIEEVKAKNFG